MAFNNCWSKRTSLEVALILILLVSTAFLIGMIVTYATFYWGEKSVNCRTFCNEMNMTYVASKFRRNLPFDDDVGRMAASENDYLFLASVIQNVYDDDNEEQRYLGAGLILSKMWVLSSAEVIKDIGKNFKSPDGIYVRTGSNYWSKGGTVHEIDKITQDIDEAGKETFLVHIYVKEKFPKINTITKLSRTGALEQRSSIFTMFGWKVNDDLPLRKRFKFKPSEKKEIRILSDSECDDVTGGLLNVFCGVEVIPSEMCTNDLGFPLLQDESVMAVQVHEYCDKEKNRAVHVFRDLSASYNRVVDLITP